MKTWIGLLRAVNVGGTGKLPMAELRALCAQAGFADARTYIASGNVLLRSRKTAKQVKSALESTLAHRFGTSIGVFVRTPAEMAEVLDDNPFADAPGNRCVAIFLDAAPPVDALDKTSGQSGERLALGKREIYVHYVDGMAESRLKIPAASSGTARNMNTIAKLVEMANDDDP